MIISHFQVIPYSIPFVKPLQTAGETYTHRKGVWLKLQSEKITGFGEAAPLSGFSSETLKEVHYALEGFHQTIEGENFGVTATKPLHLKSISTFNQFGKTVFIFFSILKNILLPEILLPVKSPLAPNKKRLFFNNR